MDSAVKAMQDFKVGQKVAERICHPVVSARKEAAKDRGDRNLCPRLHGNQYHQPSCRMAQVSADGVAAYIKIPKCTR